MAEAEIGTDLMIIRKRTSPTIITPGNHELYAKTGWFTPRRPCDATAYYKAVTKIKNCTLLRGPFATYSDQNLTVSALNPPGAWFETERESSAAFQAALRRLPKTSTNRFHILLSHSPNGWLEKNRLLTDHSADSKNPVPHFDLILSGHNHGGFVPPILRPLMHHYGFVGPYFKLVQAHAHGHWSTDQTSLILSSGVTKFAPLPGLKTLGKLTNRLLIPEIEEIILLPGERHALRAGAPESHRQG